MSSFSLVVLLFMAADLRPVPELPPGAHTHWIVEDPHEVVGYLVFDPGDVMDRIPRHLRLVSVQEVASSGIPWAAQHLAEHPPHGDWAISFLEVVRTGTFQIDGKAPAWPPGGAVGLWCVRVAPADPSAETGSESPFLVLEFWMPDAAYAEYMRQKGHYATYGKASLQKDAEGVLSCSIEVSGLRAKCRCTPELGVESNGSGGEQVLYPPKGSGVSGPVRVAFAGHQISQCLEEVVWDVAGDHPLSRSMFLGPSTYQHGYSLVGGAFTQ